MTEPKTPHTPAEPDDLLVLLAAHALRIGRARARVDGILKLLLHAFSRGDPPPPTTTTRSTRSITR